MSEWKTFERYTGIIEIYEGEDYRQMGSNHIATVYGLNNARRIINAMQHHDELIGLLRKICENSQSYDMSILHKEGFKLIAECEADK